VVVVNYHDDLNEVQGGAALVSSPFDRIEWLQGLVEHCGLNPLVVQANDGDEWAQLALQRCENGLSSLCNWYNFAWRPRLSERGGSLLTPLAQDLAKRATFVSFAPLPDEAGEATLLDAAFRAAGWLTFRSQCDVNHVLPVNGRSYAAFLAARPGQVRTTLKRKASKVAVTIETEFNPANWAAYEAIYAESWKPGEGSPAFLRAFAKAEGAAGRLRLGFAHADGVPVAAQFWTVEQGTAYIHKLAHTQASKPLSPGTSLSAALFEYVIDRDRVELVDFGTGDDGYKRDWMEVVRPRYRLDCYRPGNPRNWLAIARQSLRATLRRG
jgi:hypothetical protein